MIDGKKSNYEVKNPYEVATYPCFIYLPLFCLQFSLLNLAICFQFWKAKEGDFDEQTTDDWDVDMSVYYEKDTVHDKVSKHLKYFSSRYRI